MGEKDKSKIVRTLTIFIIVLISLALYIWLCLFLKIKVCDFFMISFVIVYLVICFITLLTSYNEEEKSKELLQKCLNKKSACIHRFILLKNEWNKAQYMFSMSHYFFVTCSIISAIIVIFVDIDKAEIISALGDNAVVFYTCLSILTTMLDMLINPFKIAQGYRKAFEKFSVAINAYLDDILTEEELINTLKECEKGITKGLSLD